MELVGILRVLVRARRLVLVGGLLAIAIGLHVAFTVSLLPPKLSSPRQVTGEAVARLQLDRTPSLVTNAKSDDIRVLAVQARLLADLTASEPVKADVARRVGIPNEKLLVIGPSMLAPVVPTPLAKRASEAAATVHEPYVLSVGAGLGSNLPIITIETKAPDARVAQRLAEAAVQSLDSAIPRLGSPGATRLYVRQLGPPRSASKASGSKLPVGMAAAFIVFALWCGAIVVVSGVMTRLREGAVRRVLAME